MWTFTIDLASISFAPQTLPEKEAKTIVALLLAMCTIHFVISYFPAPQTLPEKEAKTIVAQILSGLVYLNTKPRR